MKGGIKVGKSNEHVQKENKKKKRGTASKLHGTDATIKNGNEGEDRKLASKRKGKRGTGRGEGGQCIAQHVNKNTAKRKVTG